MDILLFCVVASSLAWVIGFYMGRSQVSQPITVSIPVPVVEQQNNYVPPIPDQLPYRGNSPRPIGFVIERN